MNPQIWSQLLCLICFIDGSNGTNSALPHAAAILPALPSLICSACQHQFSPVLQHNISALLVSVPFLAEEERTYLILPFLIVDLFSQSVWFLHFPASLGRRGFLTWLPVPITPTLLRSFSTGARADGSRRLWKHFPVFLLCHPDLIPAAGERCCPSSPHQKCQNRLPRGSPAAGQQLHWKKRTQVFHPADEYILLQWLLFFLNQEKKN